MEVCRARWTETARNRGSYLARDERTVWQCGERMRAPVVSRPVPVLLETNSDRLLTCYSENYQHDEAFAPYPAPLVIPLTKLKRPNC